MTRIDLHMHSTASDGVLSPTQVVQLAKERGLTTIALTDHDTTSGWEEALAAGRELGVEVLGGFEINSETDLGHIDFLVYGADADNAELQDFLLTIRDARVGRAKGMVKKLAELGMPLEWERVLHFAGDAQSIARPHVARALVEAGYVASTQEAFDKYLNDQGPAYVHRLEVKPQEVIDTIHQAGGVIVLSSPDHSEHDAADAARWPRWAWTASKCITSITLTRRKRSCWRWREQHQLIVTGGSDFHGDKTHAELGSVYVPPEVLTQLKERIARRA